jgi:hypothetical protein
MKKPDWQKLAGAAADPARVRHFLGLLADTSAGPRLDTCSEASRRALTALLSGSSALGNLLVANPDWLPVLDIESLRFPRRAQGLQHEAEIGRAHV